MVNVYKKFYYDGDKLSLVNCTQYLTQTLNVGIPSDELNVVHRTHYTLNFIKISSA